MALELRKLAFGCGDKTTKLRSAIGINVGELNVCLPLHRITTAAELHSSKLKLQFIDLNHFIDQNLSIDFVEHLIVILQPYRYLQS